MKQFTRSRRPVLVVDDDRIDTMTIERIFREMNIVNELHVAGNGEEALGWLKNKESEAPCIILLDLNMPRMNGIEFLKEIKKDTVLRKIPVVVLTTSDDHSDRNECFSNGAAGYMIKPAEHEQFVSLIQIIDSYWSASELPEGAWYEGKKEDTLRRR